MPIDLHRGGGGVWGEYPNPYTKCPDSYQITLSYWRLVMCHFRGTHILKKATTSIIWCTTNHFDEDHYEERFLILLATTVSCYLFILYIYICVYSYIHIYAYTSMQARIHTYPHDILQRHVEILMCLLGAPPQCNLGNQMRPQRNQGVWNIIGPNGHPWGSYNDYNWTYLALTEVAGQLRCWLVEAASQLPAR